MFDKNYKRHEVLRELKTSLLIKYGEEHENLINCEIMKLLNKAQFEIKVRWRA